MTGFIVSVFPFRNRVSSTEAFEGLELGEGKPSRPVLRGPGGRKAAWLLGQVRNSFQRWGQPGQQQGRRIPSLSSVRTRSMCCLLVSGLLTEMTQQIHSLRASGVMSSHFARAAGSEMRTSRKSAATACTARREIALLGMDFSLSPTGVILVRVVGLTGQSLPILRVCEFCTLR